MKYKNGRIYDGDWENGERHGEGTMKYASGGVFKGEWLNDKCHGQGRRKWANGNVYEGGWKSGVRHGTGTCKYADGDIYVGGWKDGSVHGNGTFKWADGDEYVGGWKDGMEHGQGKWTGSNGNVYEGEFAGGKQHGSSVLTKPSGVKYAQNWEHGKRLFSQRMVVLSDGPPSKIPWLEEHKSCQICLERFASDANGDEAARMRLPVLGACGHSCCYGCVLNQQASVACGTVPESINCFLCRDSGRGRGAFRPGEPTFNTMLIDLLARAFPAHDQRSTSTAKDAK
ncbi:hypothetical protein ACHAXT_003470 [Thalassiosira profunda]